MNMTQNLMAGHDMAAVRFFIMVLGRYTARIVPDPSSDFGTGQDP
jgi:hypothetical protein